MNIVVLGAGAIGSLFGGLLSRNNNVVLVGRVSHMDVINQKGLTIRGKTNKTIRTRAVENIKDVGFTPDLLIISVKSYDTDNAIKRALSSINDKTFVMSLQNGLDNVEIIEKHVKRERILLCITTHGVVFSKPGMINHTGMGKTVIGDISCKNKQKIQDIADIFNNAGIRTTISGDIIKDLWIKGIVNSSINPLTGIFGCKNGYLLENPVLEKIVEQICMESTSIAKVHGIDVSYQDMIKKTCEVINDTSANNSSMLQSILQGKKTEIDSINGVFVNIAEKNNVEPIWNSLLVHLIKDKL